MADYLQRLVEKQDDGEDVRGMFDCQVCRKLVQVAKYDREKSYLWWECPDGHKSEIKEFDIR